MKALKYVKLNYYIYSVSWCSAFIFFSVPSSSVYWSCV